MFDILIKNGAIIDGSGNPRVNADLAITGDKITAIEPLADVEAKTVIDAAGKVVAPGFIDMHSHSDSCLAFLPTADSKIHQGVTLEVVGQCGSSAAPLSAKMIAEMNENAARSGVDHVVDWNDFAGFLGRLRRQGTSVNVAAMAGHGTIRETVMGMSDAAPTAAQLAAMQDEVRKTIDAGAIGLTTGLIYTPNVYAETDEIIALARVAGEKGAIYASHMRGEGNTLLEAIDEALAVARYAEIPLEISHFKASGMRNWHKMSQAIEKIEAARGEGLDVTADMYPYPASNTGLGSIIPAWAHVGGRDEMIARLKDPAIRARIHEELADPINSNGIPYDAIFISSCPSNTHYEGRHLQEIADEQGKDALDAVMDILIETKISCEMIQFTMKAENVAMGLRLPYVMIGSDSSARATSGEFSRGKPHPRCYGTFPRVLGYYSREQKLFSLEEAVRKMTSLPASKLRLTNRGILKSGYLADVVVFDPNTVIDRATFTDPHQYPTGIDWVIVNGKTVVADGRHTGALPGTILTL